MAYVARSLARKGHKVTVATHAQEPAVFDSVNYVTQQEVSGLVQEQWDVVISSRWLDILNLPWNTRKKLFWTHDLPTGQEAAINANMVICLTEYHAAQWRIPDEHTAIIGNGVDLSLFSGPELNRNENRLIWTSNPERGLPVAARIFQEIRKRWPDFELHVYGRAAVYGWGPGDRGDEAPYLPIERHMENVFLHEPLTKSGLAQELKKSWAWFYPSWWPETYCIAGLEAQAAGTPCITVPEGALPETIAGGVLSYDFLNAVSQLRNPRKWEKESEAGKEFASRRDWDSIAADWEKLFVEEGPLNADSGN